MLVLLLILVASSPVWAVQVPQQRGTPCAAVWDIGTASARPGKKPGKPWELVCADGDLRCDRDGVADGSCTLPVNVCVATAPDGCAPEVVTALRIPKSTRKALRGFRPPAPSPTLACGTPGTVTMAASSVRRKSTLLALRSRTASGRGRNRLRVRCVPNDQCVDCPTTCDVDTACSRETPGLPRALRMTIAAEGSDLDLGVSGDDHNFQLTAGGRLEACLSGCDGGTDATCDATPACASAGRVLGPPQPLLSNGVPVCVVSRWGTGSGAGAMDLATGALSLPVAIDAEVYVQTADGTGNHVCPRCSGTGMGTPGTCEAGPRRGRACTVDGTATVIGSGGSWDYLLSSDCPPDADRLAATIPLTVALTTGQTALVGSRPCPGQIADDGCSGTCTVDCSATIAAKGGINQTCCSNQQTKPCFPTAPGTTGQILREGTPAILAPAWPDPAYSKTADGARLAAVTCLPKTQDHTFDILTGLPGPAAVLVPVHVEVLAQ